MRVEFAEFTLDYGARQLLRGGKALHLEPKALDLLGLLLERRPEAVAKPEIRDRIWPDTFVSESNLTGLVAQVREALGDNPRQPRYIRTVHGFGYAFAGEGESAGAEGQAPRAAPRVVWERRIIPLSPGENVIGRDEDVAVRIDSPGVSRRHARIVVEKGVARLEDLGSKNGTYLKEEKLDGSRPLEDGDTFRLGRLLLVFRNVSVPGATKTEIGGD